MKLLKLTFLTLISLLIFNSCAMNKPQNHLDKKLHKKWMLTHFQDFTKQNLVKLNAHIDLSQHDGQNARYTAKMGCNNLFYKAKFSNDGKVKFSDVGSTMMMCDEDAMKLEDAFTKTLPSITSYKIEGHFLILSNNAGESIKLLEEDWD